MKKLYIILLLFAFLPGAIQAQSDSIFDDFEGNGNIQSWFGDDCEINLNSSNPFPQGINTSSGVMEYNDEGGQYANVRFDADQNFNMSSDYVFSLKIYVPNSALTGNQPNQVALKLQDGTLNQPWSTQSEIIKSINTDEWHTLTFDFLHDDYININAGSLPPSERTDFNRVVIQVNGEDNNDHVVAYIDDFQYYINETSDPDSNSNPEYNTLVWADEFDTDGPIDTSKWHHQVKLPEHGSWYNSEIQHYTNREENSYVNDGILHITGKKETFTDQGQTKEYTSARLNSKFAFQNGKVEVRAKLPNSPGTWPAIWMLGKNINEDGGYWDEQGFGTTPWPACGEIDIMEHWGTNQNYVQSAIHTPSSFGATVNHGGRTISEVSDEFHTYTLIWYPDKMVFSVDGIVHYTYQPTEYNENTWPFDAEQYILLNFAFLPGIDPEFEQDALEIDYVRVYQDTEVSSEDVNHTTTLYDLKAFPNPAKDQTTIHYHLPEPSKVKIIICDVNGRLIQKLVNKSQTAGEHEVKWDIENLIPGVYFYTLQTEKENITKKLLMK